MNDEWKVGDKVWWFGQREESDVVNVEYINLIHSEIIGVRDTVYIVEPGGHLFYAYVFYKTKIEAINAMKSKLEQIQSEDD